MLKIFANE